MKDISGMPLLENEELDNLDFFDLCFYLEKLNSIEDELKSIPQGGE